MKTFLIATFLAAAAVGVAASAQADYCRTTLVTGKMTLSCTK